MTTAQLAAILTVAASLCGTIGAILHSIGTRKRIK